MPRLIVHGFTISLASWLLLMASGVPLLAMVICLGGCFGDTNAKVETWNWRVAAFEEDSANKEQTGRRSHTGNVELTARLGGVVYMDTARIVHVATTLHNPASDTLHFITMSCSYEDMFLVGGNEGYTVRPRYDCFGNYPVVQSIAPGESLDQFIMIAALDKSTRIHTGRLRVGIMWMDPKEHKDIFDAYEHRKEEAHTVWSNELDLERLYRRPYK
ncbi:MAG: hypothetical protein JNL05_01020 [Flavobacteriales bacterium]|nr:hypothetical protein [Flavobacteriales bacterium]